MICIALNLLAGCRTTPRLPPVNLSEPGWQMREGQALWRSDRNAPGVAGDLLIATRPGSSLIQFSKTPFPLLAARRENNRWQMELIPAKRIRSGRGQPPAQLLWLHVADVLAGNPPPAPLSFRRLNDTNWELENPVTSEKLTGYTTP